MSRDQPENGARISEKVSRVSVLQGVYMCCALALLPMYMCFGGWRALEITLKCCHKLMIKFCFIHQIQLLQTNKLTVDAMTALSDGSVKTLARSQKQSIHVHVHDIVYLVFITIRRCY